MDYQNSFVFFSLARQFQKGILKPAFNSLDMSEVELMDDGHDARDFSKFLLDVSQGSHLFVCGKFK